MKIKILLFLFFLPLLVLSQTKQDSVSVQPLSNVDAIEVNPNSVFLMQTVINGKSVWTKFTTQDLYDYFQQYKLPKSTPFHGQVLAYEAGEDSLQWVTRASVVDSTRLLQDSILVYYNDNSEVGRDTISGVGSGGVSLVDSTRLIQDSILVYYQSGSEIGRDTLASSSSSGSVDWSNIQNIPAGFADNVDDVGSGGSLESEKVAYDKVFYRLDNLKGWHEDLEEIDTERKVVLQIGDSNTRFEQVQRNFAPILNKTLGHNGIGFVPFGANNNSPSGVSATAANKIDAGNLFGDGHHANFTSGTITVTVPDNPNINYSYDSLHVYYQQEPGAGSFRIDVGTGSLTVNADGVNETSIARVYAGSVDIHAITITHLSGGAIKMNGTFGFDNTKAGISIARFGSGGATANSFINQDSVSFVKTLELLQPDVVMIAFGSNEASNNRMSDYDPNIRRLIDRVYTYDSLTNIILIAPSRQDTNAIQNATLSSPDDFRKLDSISRDIAHDKETALISYYHLFGDYYDANARGYINDYVHLSEDGGLVAALAWRKALLESYIMPNTFTVNGTLQTSIRDIKIVDQTTGQYNLEVEGTVSFDTPNDNVLINAGQDEGTGLSNILIGAGSAKNTNNNVILAPKSGYTGTNGRSIILGFDAANAVATGGDNILAGSQIALNLTAMSNAVGFGNQSMLRPDVFTGDNTWGGYFLGNSAELIDDVTAFGSFAMRFGTFRRTTGMGHSFAIFAGGGDDNSYFGHNVGRFHYGDDATLLGSSIGDDISSYDSGTTISSTFVDPSSDKVYAPSHGLSGTNFLYYTGSTGSNIGGLGLNSPLKFTVVTSDTLQLDTGWDNMTNSGGGTHSFQLMNKYDNITLIGYNVEPEKSNQVIIGNSATTELKTGAERIVLGNDRLMIWSSGSPEGVETAPVGSLYFDTNGSTGTTMYLKESGLGNTGWVAK